LNLKKGEFLIKNLLTGREVSLNIILKLAFPVLLPFIDGYIPCLLVRSPKVFLLMKPPEDIVTTADSAAFSLEV
jgi:hypothetical protein